MTLPAYNSLTAAATIITPKRTLSPEYTSVQEQLWDYYDRLGEYEAGVGWKANSLSRVRLLAAELQPSGQEPVPITEGPAAEAVERLAGGIGGQAQLMKQATIHLSVPGEGWMVGEVDRENGEPRLDPRTGQMMPDDERWQVLSADELQRSNRRDDRGRATFEVREGDDNQWRPIDGDSIVVRFWHPHPRFKWRADSAGRHALNHLQELDAVNRRILVMLNSRLASNGFLLYDKRRLSIITGKKDTEGGQQDTDPFADVMVAVASKTMRDVNSPESIIPIPVGFDIDDPSEIDPRMLMQHIKLADVVDDKLLQHRDAVVRELAATLDMPAEILLGMSGLNHWGQWQIEESGIKIHIAPMAELICYSLTTGFLVPTLKAGGHSLRGPNGGRLVVWYDPSEIVQRPDKSSLAVQLGGQGRIKDEAVLRETGFDEQDQPNTEELQFIVARQQSLLGTTATPEVPNPPDDDTGPPDTDQETIEEAEPDEGPPDGPAPSAPELALNGSRR